MELYKVSWTDANVQFEEYIATPNLETLEKALEGRSNIEWEILATDLNIL